MTKYTNTREPGEFGDGATVRVEAGELVPAPNSGRYDRKVAEELFDLSPPNERVSNERLAEMLAEVQAATAAAIGEWPYKASAGVTFDTMCSILTELQSCRQSPAGVEALLIAKAEKDGPLYVEDIREVMASLSVKEPEGVCAYPSCTCSVHSRCFSARLVQPWETRPQGDDAMEPDEVNVFEGSWDVVIGTNAKPAGWIDTHALLGHQVYRDRLVTAPKEPEGVEPVAWRWRFEDVQTWTVQKNKPYWYTPNQDDIIMQPLYASPPKAVMITDEMAERVFNAAWDCPHSIDGSAVTLRIDPTKPGNALSQLHRRLTAAISTEPHNG